MQQRDLRVQRTRDAIRQTFREMLLEMDYEKITIKELTLRANINRRTFYLHYTALEDLLNELMDEIADEYIKTSNKLSGLTEMPQIVRGFLQFFAGQDPLYEKIICHENFRYVSDRINRRISAQNHGHIDDMGNVNPYEKNIMITYLNSSALAMYRKWVSDKKKISQEAFLDLATQLICSGIMSIPGYLKREKTT